MPVIALDQRVPEQVFKRGGRLVKETWGERVRPAHSIGLLALLVLVPIIVLFAMPTLREGLAAHNADLVWVGLSVMMIAISSYTQLNALVNAMVGLAAYRYATARKSDVFPGDPSYAEHAFVNHPILKKLGLCLNPARRIVHHRPIDCGPAASHEAMAAMDAPTVNILPGSGLSARTSRMSSVLMCKPFSQRRPVECLPHICTYCTTKARFSQRGALKRAKAGRSSRP